MNPSCIRPSLAAAPVPLPPPQCGPRFELKPYQIRLGTVDQQHAENEWVLRSYTRSAKKERLVDTSADAAAK